jgi:putative ABC transport system permease protein
MSMTATRMLARDWRGGELGVLVMALVLAVGTVAGISAFTTRLQSALEQESHRFLAADLVVSSGRDIAPEWLQTAGQRDLSWARTLSFPSMVYAGEEEMYLASVKAVSDRYPLRGELTYSDQPFGEVRPAQSGPAPGEVWLDSRLFPLLSVEIGDRVGIGDAEFLVTAAARTEPDQGASFYGYGPRVLMHYADIPATGVVQVGSRVEYRQLYAGETDKVGEFAEWLRPQLAEGQSLLDVREGQPGIGSALQRAESFLLLAGSLAVVLAGVAIALAARRFSERHNDYVAIMKSLGATSTAVNRLYGRSLLILGLAATLAGCLLGWALQALFFKLFAEQLPVEPGPSGLRPYAIGSATSLTCLLCFAWPPLRRLGQASPLRVLRRDLPMENRRTVGDYSLGLLAVSLLMWWYSGDWRLTLAVLAGLAIALQVVIFAMAIMLLLVSLLVRTSLIDEWQMQLPDDTPNHFIINIGPEQVQGVDQILRQQQIGSEPLFPMIRGRIMSVNGEELPRTEDRSQGRRQRESNFTWATELPGDNRLVAGEWWDADTSEALVSLESEYAERLGVGLGDTLGFLVGSQPLQARVASIRELEWQSMRPNFFLIFPPRLLADYPATFMTSFHLEAQDKRFLNRFIREFPTVTVIEMDVVVEQVRSIVRQVSAAIELVLVVILVAGGLVLVAGVQASVDARMHESAILRALGARRRLVLGGLLIEFATLGLFAGLLATVAAEMSVYILQTWVMEMQYAPSPWVWLPGLLGGAVLVGGLGVFSCRRVVSSPPVALLREL